MHISLKWRIAQKLELLWWKQYLGRKNRSVYFDWKTQYWQRFLKDCQFSQQVAVHSILDAGCGPAGIFTTLSEYQVTAIDPLLEKYDKNLDDFRRDDYPWVAFYAKPIEAFTTTQTFDAIFCVNAINHVNCLSASIAKLKTLLAKNGTLYLTTDVHNNIMLKKLFRAIPGDALHPHQHSARDYEHLIKKCGLKIISNKCLKAGNIFNYQLFILQHDTTT